MPRVYECRPSYEVNRPQIDFEAAENAQNDWLVIGEVLDGSRPLRDFPDNVVVTVVHGEATQWDCYMVAGTRGLFSQRFVNIVGTDALRGFSLLPVKLNDGFYFLLRCNQPIDCLDRAKSAFDTFRSDPTTIKRITHYGFHEDRLPNDICFCIAELPDLLLTEYVVRRLESAKLKGLRLLKLP